MLCGMLFFPHVCRLEDEKRARMELERDVEDLKKTNKDTKLNCKQTEKEIDLVKEELYRLKQEHKLVRLERKSLQETPIEIVKGKPEANLLLQLLQEVEVLREKIKDSEVKVEIDSKNSDLAEMLSNVRKQYDKLAEKNLKETEEWYQSKVCFTCCIVRLDLGVSLPLVFIMRTSFLFSSLKTSRW